MTWWAIDLRPSSPEQLDWMSAWLVSHTGLAVEERPDGTLVTFAVDEPSAGALLQALRFASNQPLSAACRPLEEVDWSLRWRDGLGARRFGRLTVVPSWIPEASHPDSLTVVLDPETAFGSGEHGSTRAALTLLEQLLRPGDRVLDLGSGSGILAIAAIKLGAARAIGIETDGEANEIAARNAQRNQVSRRIELLEGDAADLAPLLGPADLILSNILRKVNLELLPAIVTALAPTGIVIFSGMEAGEADGFRPEIEAAGLRATAETFDDGWWAVAAVR
jgi:ribosomal protein L11 methyltransferase